jgi:hypothetical protein
MKLQLLVVLAGILLAVGACVVEPYGGGGHGYYGGRQSQYYGGQGQYYGGGQSQYGYGRRVWQ